MANVCPITGKKKRAGKKRSYSQIKTPRWFEVNFQPATFTCPVTGKKVRFKKISTKAKRTISKQLMAGKKINLTEIKAKAA